MEAVSLYEQAAKSARENHFINIDALANELAARHWLEKGNRRYASIHLQDALLGYRLWGAEAKVRALSLKYPMLAMGIHLPPTGTTGAGSGLNRFQPPLKETQIPWT